MRLRKSLVYGSFGISIGYVCQCVFATARLPNHKVLLFVAPIQLLAIEEKLTRYSIISIPR